MASEIALRACESLPAEALVLDPMAGSGTVLRIASESGHRAVGLDMDPLAVLLSRVWTTAVEREAVLTASEDVLREAKRIPIDAPLPWIDDDDETRKYVDYWYAVQQRNDLRRLAHVLARRKGAVADALRVAFSRLIITKERGASLAADVSHSRPHRVRTENDFPVFEEFVKSARTVVTRLQAHEIRGPVDVYHGDGRRLGGIDGNSVDAVITSPPYLNAIDYLRGHKLSLVWFGHSVRRIRTLRSDSVGAERAPDAHSNTDLAHRLTQCVDPDTQLPRNYRRMVDRYALDMYAFLREIKRALRPGSPAVFVIGDSCLRKVYIKNSEIVRSAAQAVGLEFIEQRTREIPEARRYLPPPSAREASSLKDRMRTEVVQMFRKTA
jgi:hypothetical protein